MAGQSDSPNRRYGLYLSDLRRGRTDSHGVINYAVGLASSLWRCLDDAEHLVVYANAEIAKELTIPSGLPNCEIHIQSTPSSAITRLWSDHIRAPTTAGYHRLDVLHFPKGHVPIAAPGLRVIATLHDDIPVQYAAGRWGRSRSWPARLKGRYFSWAVQHAIRRSDLVIAVSRFSLEALGKLARGELPSSVVTHEGITLPEQPFVPVAAKRPYLLHLGSQHPHKRSHEAVEFSLRFISEHDSVEHLAVTGKLDEPTEALAADPRVQRITRVLDNAELAGLISEARALIFTSEYEGFGLPPVESYCQGTPAAYAAATSLPEVMNGAPGSYTGSYASFREGLREALRLEDSQLLTLRDDFRTRYSWAAVASSTVAAYRQVCDNRMLSTRP